MIIQDLTKGRAKFSIFNHPLMQAQNWAMPELYEWQREIMEEVSKPGARVVVSGNNSMGKTRILVPLLGLSVMAAFPGATVFSTAGAESQIKDQLFKYLDAILRPYARSGWKITLSGLTVAAPPVRGLQSKWVAKCPKDALTMQGYHGSWEPDDNGKLCWCPICVIIDEAQAVEARIYESAWRIEPDFLFVISTPDEDSGPFYKAIDPDTLEGGVKRDPGGLWHYRRMISRRDCPHLMTVEAMAYRDLLIDKFGPRSSFIRSFVDGAFQRDTDENQVFTDTDIERVKAAMKPKGTYNPGKKFAGLEFSGGGDEQVIMILDGDKVVYKKEWREEDTDKLAQDFLIDLRRFEIPARDCIGDSGGEGHAIINNMEGRDYRGIERYMNQQEAVDRREYADRITEDHYRFKEMLRLNPGIQLPDDPVLLKQMRQRRFCSDEHNRIKLEPKQKHRKRCQESPDRLDTLIMLFSRWRPPKNEKREEEYRSPLEEEAQRRSGRGAGAAFGWIKPQKPFAETMRGRR